MNIKAYIVGVHRENRDGTSRQQLISRLRDGEDLYLYDAASERNPDAIAVLNYDNMLCGFLDADLAYAIRQNMGDIGNIPAYVCRVLRDNNGTFQCEIELGISEDSRVGYEYNRLTSPPEEAPRTEPRRSRASRQEYTEDRTPSRQRTNETSLVCPRCGSTNINVQIVNETKQKRGCFGCLVRTFLFFFTFFLWLLSLLIPKGSKSKTVSYAVCQNCGHKWRV